MNLVPSPKPGDVYTAVLRIVKQHIHEDLNSKDPMIRRMAELLRGGELYTNICGRAILSEEEAFKIIYPLTDCLSYMHSMGIIHRDIKVCVCGGRER